MTAHPSRPDLIAALQVAREALRTSYNVTTYPGDGTSHQDKAIRVIDAALASEPEPQPVAEIRIVFDGFPSPNGPRFIEVENAEGRSINIGRWRRRDDGLCELVIS